MKIRGERECKECGARWSYYETGAVECPECGGLRSVGVDERKEHTASAVTLDLTAMRNAVGDDAPIRDAASDAAEACAEYCRKAGFIDAGSLKPLSETYLAAAELRYVGEELARRMRHSEDEELYFLSLLREADQDGRPEPAAVPGSLQAARGLGVARAVEEYVHDLRTHLDDDADPMLRSVLSGIAERRKRIEALDGDVDPSAAETLVRAVRDAAEYVQTGDETALTTARSRLDDVE
ncbi:TFIIB-type zinc ribbon-containing protein [Haloarculaceae archaeon H-GB2-1]|nr:TFIIB-type zinc ribbon-containing protein [Haloarculaceae archaeon H-GB1-1]MEA5385957.1 TFIIB-type zinc ribbon-containing protein [Haloarculaceae archaeon H-GB11]MEA5407462.1 TFIIB-type zinc ribbon-containing protein [Haloarculaceae archaeon H-GB2-1]